MTSTKKVVGCQEDQAGAVGWSWRGVEKLVGACTPVKDVATLEHATFFFNAANQELNIESNLNYLLEVPVLHQLPGDT